MQHSQSPIIAGGRSMMTAFNHICRVPDIVYFAWYQQAGTIPFASSPSLARKRSMELMVEAHKPPKDKLVDNLRPPCSGCGKPLILTRIEPEAPGHDLRVYYCAACSTNETIVAPIRID